MKGVEGLLAAAAAGGVAPRETELHGRPTAGPCTEEHEGDAGAWATLGRAPVIRGVTARAEEEHDDDDDAVVDDIVTVAADVLVTAEAGTLVDDFVLQKNKIYHL